MIQHSLCSWIINNELVATFTEITIGRLETPLEIIL